jgi:hypothetical protein
MQLSWLIASAATMLVCACAAPQAGGKQNMKPTEAVNTMTLTSPAFTEGQPIPRRFSGDGENVSPALQWDKTPAGTQSFALICRDPDAPGRTFIHWVIYNIPDTLRQLPEGLPRQEKLDNGITQGESDFGRAGYGGPKPPSGKAHRYFFDLYALDTVLAAEPRVDAGRLQQLMKGHVLATAELMGTYQR